MVDVHDVVADLDGLQFLEGEGEFARAGAVALEGVFVEAVENLVVGEDTDLAYMVYEALVESAEDGLEGDFVTAVFEYGTQTRELLVRVAEDVYAVALGGEIAQGFAY